MHDQKFDPSVLVLALLLALFSSPAHSAPPAAPGVKAVVAKVGERPITHEDILHTMQIEKFYKSPELSEADALFIIMQDAIAHEVAHSVGVDVTPRETPVSFPFVKQFTPRAGKTSSHKKLFRLKNKPFTLTIPLMRNSTSSQK